MGWLRLFGNEEEGEDEGEDDEAAWEEEDEVGRLPQHLGSRLVFDVTGMPVYVPVVADLSQGRRPVEDMSELGSQGMDVSVTGDHDRPEQGRAGVGSSLLRRYTHEISRLEKGKLPFLSEVHFTLRPVEHGSRRGAADVHCLSTAGVEPSSHINTAEGMPLVDGMDDMIAGEVEHVGMRITSAGSGDDRADDIGVGLHRCAGVERSSHGGAGQVVCLLHQDGKTTVAKPPASSNDGDGGGTWRTVEPRSRSGKAVAEVEPCSLAPKHSRDRKRSTLAASGEDCTDGGGVVMRRCVVEERGSHGGAGPDRRFSRLIGKTTVAKPPASSKDGRGTLRTVEPRSRSGAADAEVELCSLVPGGPSELAGRTTGRTSARTSELRRSLREDFQWALSSRLLGRRPVAGSDVSAEVGAARHGTNHVGIAPRVALWVAK